MRCSNEMHCSNEDMNARTHPIPVCPAAAYPFWLYLGVCIGRATTGVLRGLLTTRLSSPIPPMPPPPLLPPLR